jgi:ribosome-binding protein aMBF1 (putative translation factor)
MDVINLHDHRVRKSIISAGSGQPNMSGDALKAMRKESGVLKRQMAAGLAVSVATIERWEQSDVVPLTDTVVANVITNIRLADPKFEAGKNLCFGRFPMRVAREILELSMEQMAVKYQYSVSQWKKIESHERKINSDVLKDIEEDVRGVFFDECL